MGSRPRKAIRSLAQISDEEDAELTQAAAADSDNPIIDERMFAHMRPAVEGVPEIVPAPAISVDRRSRKPSRPRDRDA
jgi:hypothetical protein